MLSVQMDVSTFAKEPKKDDGTGSGGAGSSGTPGSAGGGKGG
jgi:hypothetical protein